MKPISIPSSAANISRDHILFLLLFGISFCVIGINFGSLASWDEAYYATVSRGIYESGDWINLRFFDATFFDKPPLYMWLTAAFYHLFGVSEFTSRLVSGLAGVGTVLVTYLLATRLYANRVIGFAAAGILLSSTDFLHYSRWGTLDITNIFFMTLAIYAFMRATPSCHPDMPTSSNYYLLFGLASGCAIMTKGPLIVLAWLIIGLGILLNKFWDFLKDPKFWWGMVLMLAIVLPWHLAAYLQDPDLFYSGYIYKHFIARTTMAIEGHAGGYYYYVRTLINKFHPWVIFVPFALLWMLWRIVKAEKKLPYALPLAWAAVIFGFFTFLVKTKLQWYILPMNPALAIMIGAMLVELVPNRSEWLLKIPFAAILILHIPLSSVMVQDYSPAIKYFASSIQEKTTPGDTVFLYEYHDQPAALYYFWRKVEYLDSLPEVDKKLGEKPQGFLLLVPTQKYAELEKEFAARGFSVLERTEKYRDNLVLLVVEYPTFLR